MFSNCHDWNALNTVRYREEACATFGKMGVNQITAFNTMLHVQPLHCVNSSCGAPRYTVYLIFNAFPSRIDTATSHYLIECRLMLLVWYQTKRLKGNCIKFKTRRKPSRDNVMPFCSEWLYGFCVRRFAVIFVVVGVADAFVRIVYVFVFT